MVVEGQAIRTYIEARHEEIEQVKAYEYLGSTNSPRHEMQPSGENRNVHRKRST